MGEVVLITGATGFIAPHIIQQLLKQGYRVRGTVRNPDDEQKIKPLRALESDTSKFELVKADLLDADCWSNVVDGCSYVLHTASPFPLGNPKDEDELIKPAVEGTLNVLRACGQGVKRVVLTSSVAAIYSGTTGPSNGKAYTEDDFAVPDKAHTAYERSKALAERAAWDYVNGLPEDRRFEMAVMNPALVMGPMISGSISTSIGIVLKIMSRSDPMLPRLNFSVVDVREVAAAHIVAMKSPQAAGKRHILSGKNMWFKDMALVLEKEFKPMGYKVPTTNAPYFILWCIARFDEGMKAMLPAIGKEKSFDNTRMTQVLGITTRPVEETIVDCCYSMIETGILEKTGQYKPKE